MGVGGGLPEINNSTPISSGPLQRLRTIEILNFEFAVCGCFGNCWSPGFGLCVSLPILSFQTVQFNEPFLIMFMFLSLRSVNVLCERGRKD